MYSDSYATLLGYNLTTQFSKKTGYSATTPITEANQFSSKTYVDTLINGLSSIYATLALTYSKIQSDARYYLNTV